MDIHCAICGCSEKCAARKLSVMCCWLPHWNDILEEAGRKREIEISSTFWKELINRGARMVRYKGDRASGFALIEQLATKNRVTLDIQRELVDERKSLIEISADHAVNEDLIKLQQKYKDQLNKGREEWDAAVRTKDEKLCEEMAEERKRLEQVKNDRNIMLKERCQDGRDQ